VLRKPCFAPHNYTGSSISGAVQHVSKYNNLNFGMPRLVGGEHQFEAFYFAIELLFFTISSVLDK
jgi:hypothetical protein